MKKPNLFIVGGLRSGTTLLYELLRQHPDVYFPEEKDSNFFCKDLYEESLKLYGKNIYFHITTLKKYLSLFKNARNKRVIGDATAVYLYSKVAPYEIHQFNPNAKIIILLREPVEFMYSLHSWLLNYMMEDKINFEEALELEESRKKGINIPKKARYPSYLFYRTKTKYLDYIGNYLQYFPSKQVHIIIFEKLIRAGDSGLKRILEFLNIPSDFQTELPVINQNKITRSKFISDVIQSKELKRFVRKWMPTGPGYYKMKKLVEKFIFKNVKRPPMNNNLKIRLKNEYQTQIEELNRFLNENRLIHCDLLNLWEYRNNTKDR